MIRGTRFALVLAAAMLVGLAHSPNGVTAGTCLNESFRTGVSANLPDCRAYELVSPADSNGRLLESLNTFSKPPGTQVLPSELVSPNHDSVAYLGYQSPLPGVLGPTGVADVYVANRGALGWSTNHRLSLSGSEARGAVPGGVSPDHLFAVSTVSATFVGAPVEVNESFLVDANGSPELLGLGSLGVEPYAQGRYLGKDGAHIIFSTGPHPSQSQLCFTSDDCKVRKLELNAPPEGTGAIYDRSADGPTHVVSLLPEDKTPNAGEQAFYKGVSKDGTAVAFVIGGILYVRVPDSEDGETVKVAEGNPTYAGLSEEGRYLFYIPGGDKGTIHRFDTKTEADVEINPGAPGEIVNISGDGSHVYFISEEEIDSEGESSKPNLFVWSGGSSKYITTVAPSDLDNTSGNLPGLPALTNWTGWLMNQPENGGDPGPGADSSRATPDGKVLAFESRAKLTSYENAGHTEIYRYEEGKGLACVSCNFGTPADGDARFQELEHVYSPMIVHNLSEDGRRVFFETPEALVDRDINGVNDIYEWQEEGSGETVDLVSSGQSIEYLRTAEGIPAALPNLLFSITPDGEDVVFLAQEALVPGAPKGGAPAIYDARVGGGFAQPQPLKVCLEEECHPAHGSVPSPSPELPSETAAGAGNVKPRKHQKQRCRRKQHSRKHRRCGRHMASHHTAGTGAVAQEGRSALQGRGEPYTQLQAVQRQTIKEEVPSSSRLASPSVDSYGVEAVSATTSTSSAGAHPDFTTNIALNHTVNASKEPEEAAATEEAVVSIPPGLLGNINSTPRCETGSLIAWNCPISSQVGLVRITATALSGELTEPVYNLEPPHPDTEIARLGFIAGVFPVFIDIKVRTATDYGVDARVYGASGEVSLVTAKTTLWGNPADPVHDEKRLTVQEANECTDVANCNVPGGGRPSGLSEPFKAFMTNPSACQPMGLSVAVRSYQLPGQVFEKGAALEATTDCSGLPFGPTFSAEPTSHVAGAPTGLKTKLVLPQHLGPEEKATATMREARVTLPAGMQIAAGAANWIDTCAAAQVGFHEEVDARCPDASKLGTATISSPALAESIQGTIYQRTPRPGQQFGLWLVADALGLHVKLPGELEADKQTGRLTAVFHDLPQVPVEEIDLNVWGGPRAPLMNPDHCGTFVTDYSFTPHSEDAAAIGQATMQITEGCNQPFDPQLRAGVTNPVAGQYSPLVVDLTHGDGQQALRGFELKLPDGELAKLKGVPLCSDAAAASGTCPATSKVGELTAVAGPGPEPLAVPQPGKAQPQIFLAGPYEGSPYSIVSEVPAQAGPFDLGTLLVRSGLDVEPETARAIVKADPLPQFFEGVGITYRRLHAVINRSDFSLNPTDCSALAVTADVTSTQGTSAHPSARFKVDGCKRLKFKPKLSLKLRGGTERSDYPALTAVLKARRGDANLASTSVALPHSEFLAQEHIVTICTRKQFAAAKCPKGSIYGRAKAWTPLLDKPLEGPVYLRSSSHPLPDMVVALRNQLEIDLIGRIDSTKGGGIRASFESIPDAPVTKFVLRMRGGDKGLLVNSTDICQGTHKATAKMRAQNGRRVGLRPALTNGACLGRKH